MTVKKKNNSGLEKINFTLAPVEAWTDNQKIVLASKRHLILCGYAGTGKSFLSLALGYADLRDKVKDKVIIMRSAVPTRDLGFLPGTEQEKTRVYEAPYVSITSKLFNRGDAYSNLKSKDLVNFEVTSYLRSITYDDATIIVDECQNMSLHELDSVITRVGSNCRLIFCGDFYQSDLRANGLRDFLKILNATNEFDSVTFGAEDIVRSTLVKKYIIAKENLNLLLE